MKVLDALPTIKSMDELEGFLEQGRLMKATYTVEEWAAIEHKKIELKPKRKRR